MKADQGGYAGGRVAFGYKANSKILTVDIKQAETVKRVFALRYSRPTWSLNQIAEQLNQEGYKTTKGKDFTKVQVKRILDRKSFYQGNYTYGEIEVKGIHQPII